MRRTCAAVSWALLSSNMEGRYHQKLYDRLNVSIETPAINLRKFGQEVFDVCEHDRKGLVRLNRFDAHETAKS